MPCSRLRAGAPLSAFHVKRSDCSPRRRKESTEPAAWPTLARRVVFVTGDDARADSGDFLRRAGQPVVRKPFEIADLLAAVTAVAAPV